MPSQFELKTLWFRSIRFERVEKAKDERGWKRGRCSFSGLNGERHLRGQKPQESRRSRPKLNVWEATRGAASEVGSSRWSASKRPEGFLGKRRNGEINLERINRSLWRSKALKGKAQECWGLK